jgi:acyl-coenzyme A synthetase/AMP-(fatty) acid ligase
MKIFENLPYSTNPIIIEDNGMTLSHKDLNTFADMILPLENGVKSVVFCLCKNTIPSLAGYISFLRAGFVPLLLDGEQDMSLINTLLDIYKPLYIWLPQSAEENFIETEKILSFHSYTLLKTKFNNQVKLYDDLALLLTTSGSTGSPKLVRLSYRNILSNAQAIAEYLNIDSNERPITSLPMFYTYGLSVINSHLIKGATILLTEKPVIQKEFWNFAKTQKATSITGVPYTYEMLKRLHIFNMDIPELKTMTQAGGKLNAEVAKWYIEQAKDTGRKFIVMYGQTEATARMSYLPFDKALNKYGSIGIAIPGGKFSLRDENGKEITEADRDGELVYSGPNVSLGYAECKEDLVKGNENNGVLYTGDIARRDIDGFYYITGRMKRFVKMFGNRVNLDAIEQMVKNVTTFCACVGIDDMITVFVIEHGLENTIKTLLSTKTGFPNTVFVVKYIDEIPQNASGKIQYSDLEKIIGGSK